MPRRSLVLAALLAAAPAAAAAPTVEESRTILEQSVKETDPVKAQALAARAADGFVAARRDDVLDCWLLAVTAEAQIRAGRPKDALATVALGARPECDAASFAALSAWAHEYAPDGLRRGAGADLPLSVMLYLRAAQLRQAQPDSVTAQAAALANAAEIAAQIGDADTAREAGLRCLDLRPERDLAVRCGVAVIQASSPQLGEGAATDLVADAAGGAADLLRDVLDARNAQVGQLLDLQPGDPYLLAAAGFYALFTGGDIGAHLARRHLDRAAESGFPLPEVAYLRGRAAALRGDAEAAKAFFRQQQADFPKATASVLAANDLALLLAREGGTPDEMTQALQALDARLREQPAEPALHETRALLLERMGRRAEALASMERAQGLEPHPEREQVLSRLRQAP